MEGLRGRQQETSPGGGPADLCLPHRKPQKFAISIFSQRMKGLQPGQGRRVLKDPAVLLRSSATVPGGREAASTKQAPVATSCTRK